MSRANPRDQDALVRMRDAYVDSEREFVTLALRLGLSNLPWYAHKHTRVHWLIVCQ